MKTIRIVATRCQILGLKCIKFDFGAPPPLSALRASRLGPSGLAPRPFGPHSDPSVPGKFSHLLAPVRAQYLKNRWRYRLGGNGAPAPIGTGYLLIKMVMCSMASHDAKGSRLFSDIFRCKFSKTIWGQKVGSKGPPVAVCL